MDSITLGMFFDELEKVAATLKTPLMPHQKRVVRRMEEQPGLVVAHGLGSGKTYTSIAAAVKIRPKKTTVLVPAALKANYEKEITKHVKGRPRLQVSSLQGAALKGVKKTDMLIIDEAHRARDPKSKTHRALKEAVTNKRMLLTASPVYNKPEDVAPLVNLAAGGGVLPTGRDFNRRYVAQPDTGIRRLLPWSRKQPEIVRRGELGKTLQTWVDYHQSQGGDFPQRSDKTVSVPMSKRQTKLHDYAWGRLPPGTRSRLRAGLPPNKKDLPALNAFQSQVRQISNTERPYGGPDLSPKVQRAVDDTAEAMKQNPRHKSLVYSNYLDTLNAYSGALNKSKIPHASFTGQQKPTERKAIVRDYNKGKLKALLVSTAGGEGLDLKGTRQVQVLEPHWNDEKVNQVIGRAIRHKSHAALPKKERHVDVRRYEAYPQSGRLRSFFTSKPREGIDQALRNLSTNKERVNQQVRDLMSVG